jgi:hypothetical protein
VLLGGAVAAGVAVTALAGGGVWWVRRSREDARPVAALYRELAGYPARITAVAYAPDGRTLATANGNSQVTVWTPRPAPSGLG